MSAIGTRPILVFGIAAYLISAGLAAGFDIKKPPTMATPSLGGNLPDLIAKIGPDGSIVFQNVGGSFGDLGPRNWTAFRITCTATNPALTCGPDFRGGVFQKSVPKLLYPHPGPVVVPSPCKEKGMSVDDAVSFIIVCPGLQWGKANGTYHLTARIDSTHQFAESSEANNFTSRSIVVPKIPKLIPKKPVLIEEKKKPSGP